MVTRRRGSVLALLGEVPAALLIGLTFMTSAVLLMGTIIDAPLREPYAAPALLVFTLATSTGATWWLSAQSRPSLGWVGLFPTGWIAGLGLLQLELHRPESFEWFIGGDNVRHVGLVAELVAIGDLSYSDNAYPRAWHSALSLIWLVGDKELDEGSFQSFIALNATATWFLFALLVLATGNLAAALVKGMRPSRELLASGCAFVAGCWLMTPRFMADTLALGFQTTLLASVVLAVAARECVIDRKDRLHSFAVLVAMVVLMAHTWQLLVPVVALPAVVVGWRLINAGRRTVVVALVLTTAAAVIGLPPVLAAFTGPGVGAAAAPGVSNVPGWPVLLVSSAAAAFVASKLPGRNALATVALVFTPTLGAALIAILLDVSISSYYPSKLLWHTVALGLSFLATLSVTAVARSSRSTPLVRLGGVLVGIGTMAFVLWGLVTPLGSQFNAWSSVDAKRVMGAVTTPGASEAQGIWMGSPTESAVTRTLLASVRGELVFDDRLTVTEECVALRAAPEPTVLTSQPVAEARLRYDCVDRLVILAAHR